MVEHSIPGLSPPSAAAPSRGAAGQVLSAKYEYVLVREIGRGGMGEVWQAQRRSWRAPVAVKLMTLPATPLARERFEREASVAAQLRSTHVVHVLDHGVDVNTGALFLVMELLEGESLANRLRRLKILSPGEVMMLVTHIGRALARAHEAEVVHRDLKPDNVFYVANDDEPLVKVLDFGLAKVFRVSMADPRAVTMHGTPVGTPCYMSPEQIHGATDDHFGDLWSLAVIACECLTGALPFYSQHLPTLIALLSNRVRPVPSQLGSVPAGFDTWFAKATHPDVERRFHSAKELVDALRPVCGTSRTSIPPLQYERLPPQVPSLVAVTRPPPPRSRVARRSPVVLGSFGAAALVSAVVATRAYLSQPDAVGTTPPVVTGAAPPPPPTLAATHEPAEARPAAATDAPAAPLAIISNATTGPASEAPAAPPAQLETPKPSPPPPERRTRHRRLRPTAPAPAQTASDDRIRREF